MTGFIGTAWVSKALSSTGCPSRRTGYWVVREP
jgi:hypothetical protein